MGVILVASHPEYAEQRFVLDDACNVGSAPANHLHLAPPVDPFHARFIYRDARLIVVDLRSSTGTSVNGRRIDAPVIVRWGEEVSVGDWIIRVDESDRPEQAFPGRSERERELFAALATTPSNDELRQVYGDWLEENGYTKEAEVLSLEREIRDGEGRIDEVSLGRLGYRLRMLSEELPFAWRAVQTRPRIEGCPRPADCPRTWDRLEPTPSTIVRRCRVCAERVHLAETMEIARHRAAQKHPVAVDVSLQRYPRDLEVALALLPPAAAPIESNVMELALFSNDEPPGTVGGVLRSLKIDPPAELGPGNNMGFYTLPEIAGPSDLGDARTISPLIQRVNLRYDWDMYHGQEKRRFSEIEYLGYESFSVSFENDGDLVENWLRARFGPPREAIEPALRPDLRAIPHRVYGHWLYEERLSGGCHLEWVRTIPDWALPPADKQVSLLWLNELTKLLVRDDCTYEAICEFCSRPPARSNIQVLGKRGTRQDFGLDFKPKLTAFEVAHALEMTQPIGTSGDVHMSHWSVREKNSESRLGYPTFGRWCIEIQLDDWPSGTDVPDRYASKHLGPKDLASGITITPLQR